MSSQFQQLKPIKVWGKGGANPPKVAILLEELGLPFETVVVPFADVKNPEYVAINPNGRVPSIHDPNTDITLWESGAIIEYLIEKYDTEHKFSFAPGTPESYHAKQWLFFQVSGQGPYYGQLGWFKLFHPEKIPDVIDRYVKEVNRVSAVLDGWLAKQKLKYGENAAGDGPWFVGNKYSYVDIAFVMWQHIIGKITEKDEHDLDNFPHLKEWFQSMASRETVEKSLAASRPG
jgi:glutathione S-transferase